jgi:5-methylcytosine-specific restriction endonuclease McrA
MCPLCGEAARRGGEIHERCRAKVAVARANVRIVRRSWEQAIRDAWRDAIQPVRLNCVCCGHPMSAPYPGKLYCSALCRGRASNARRKAKADRSRAHHTWTQVIRLYLLFDRRCAYCGHDVDVPDADHVIPLARGGHDGIGNILPCCQLCNSEKRDLLLVEWAAERARRGMPARRTSWSPSDPRYEHLSPGILAPDALEVVGALAFQPTVMRETISERTACAHGHPWTLESTRLRVRVGGGTPERDCLVCKRDSEHRRRRESTPPERRRAVPEPNLSCAALTALVESLPVGDARKRPASP